MESGLVGPRALVDTLLVDYMRRILVLVGLHDAMPGHLHEAIEFREEAIGQQDAACNQRNQVQAGLGNCRLLVGDEIRRRAAWMATLHEPAAVVAGWDNRSSAVNALLALIQVIARRGQSSSHGRDRGLLLGLAGYMVT